MKKLMLIGAVALMAVSAQAAKANWQFENYAEGSDAADISSYTAYLVLASDWDSGNVSGSLSKALTSAPSSTWSDNEFDPGVYSYNGLGSTLITGIDDSLIGNGVSAYVVWADGSKYAISSAVSGDILANDDKSTPTVFSGNVALATSDLHTYGGGSVPEPTSGLLMLLGVAGLALRRRRA